MKKGSKAGGGASENGALSFLRKCWPEKGLSQIHKTENETDEQYELAVKKQKQGVIKKSPF